MLEKLLSPYPVVTNIPVQWGDMDAFEHANNVVYLQWVESGRIDYFEQIDLMDFSEGVGGILASTDIKYIFPVVYPDTLFVGTRTSEIKEDRFTLETGIFSDKHQRIVALNQAVVVTYDYAALQKAPIPERVLQKIYQLEGKTTFEANL